MKKNREFPTKYKPSKSRDHHWHLRLQEAKGGEDLKYPKIDDEVERLLNECFESEEKVQKNLKTGLCIQRVANDACELRKEK